MSENLHIKSYRLDELEGLDFSSFDYLPVSELRIKSYLKNPRATPSDKVLFIAFDGEKAIGFRTILPDTIFTKKGEFRVAILSGSHTRPDYRRKGISSNILDQVFNEWNGQIIYSNYAPNSQQLYSKSNRFQILKELSGAKFFIKSPLENIIGKRFPELAFSTPILRVLDLSANAFFNKKASKSTGLIFEKIDEISKKNTAFLSVFLKNKKGVLRGTEELNWIIENPWISDNSIFAEAQKKYPFTLFTKKTKRLNFSIKKENQVIGFLMIFQKNSQLTIPYLYLSASASRLLNEIANFIHQQVLELNASTLLIADPKLAESYKKTGGFIFSKKRNQTFFISKKLAEQIGDTFDFLVFDGDGDHVFSN